MAEAELRPTPRNKLLGMIADALSAASSPQRTQQMQGISQMLGIPALAKTANTLSYGGSLTSGKGMTTQMTPETKDALSVLLENIPVPSGKAAAAVGGAGIIAPATKEIASTLNIEKIVDRIVNMANEGKSWWKIGKESERALREARNPGGALSIFMGPDNIPRIKIDPAVAQLAKNAPFRPVSDRYGTGVELLPEMLGTGFDPGPSMLLSDVLYHPSLYDISPMARTATIEHQPVFDMLWREAAYSPNLNSIGMARSQWTSQATKNDPTARLLEVLTHEPTHIIQDENMLRGGAMPKLESIRNTLAEAKTKGSYRTAEELQAIENLLTVAENATDEEVRQSILNDLYHRSYGEWEARQGSEYGRSLPMSNERGKTY